MNKGWISINRKVQEHWLWQEKREFSKLEAWFDILLTVNHSEQKVMIKNTLFTVKRGESIKCLNTWAKRWNWNKSRVRRFFILLENDEMITTKNEHKTTRLTVCKYDSYQDKRNADETEMKQKRNAIETQLTPNNNDNNINNENNVDVESEIDAVFLKYRDKYKIYANQLYNDSIFIESISREFLKNTKPEICKATIKKYLGLFLNRLDQDKKIHNNKKEFQQHFPSWMRKQPSIEKVQPKKEPIRYF
ncbi:DUF7833 domain-containing protein [Polaribacter sp.]|uniref:DUF7833 domain-containing protein n=1 Tax=Polaribacter sp. TaxID=1920175 RepID=UPI003F6D570C